MVLVSVRLGINRVIHPLLVLRVLLACSKKIKVLRKIDFAPPADGDDPYVVGASKEPALRIRKLELSVFCLKSTIR